MDIKKLIELWFDKWHEGDFMNLPISDDFKHTSPFGTIDSKQAYLNLVNANKDKFLGYQFIIHDKIYEGNRACIRYTAIQGDFKLQVSEWHYAKNDEINEVIAYYHIGEIREDRKLKPSE